MLKIKMKANNNISHAAKLKKSAIKYFRKLRHLIDSREINCTYCTCAIKKIILFSN